MGRDINCLPNRAEGALDGDSESLTIQEHFMAFPCSNDGCVMLLRQVAGGIQKGRTLAV